VARRLLGHSTGRSLLRDTLATRDWRSELLQRLRTSPPPGGSCSSWMSTKPPLLSPGPLAGAGPRRPRGAHRPPAELTDRRLEDALSIAHWWSALRALERIQPEALRQRLDPGYDYRAGIDLCQLADRLTGDLP